MYSSSTPPSASPRCEVSAGRECCLLVLNLVSSTPPWCIRQPGPRIRVLGVCDRIQVCTQAFTGFLAFEPLVDNASSDTLALSLRLVPSLPAADAPRDSRGILRRSVLMYIYNDNLINDSLINKKQPHKEQLQDSLGFNLVFLPPSLHPFGHSA